MMCPGGIFVVRGEEKSGQADADFSEVERKPLSSGFCRNFSCPLWKYVFE